MKTPVVTGPALTMTLKLIAYKCLTTHKSNNRFLIHVIIQPLEVSFLLLIAIAADQLLFADSTGDTVTGGIIDY